MEVWKDIKGFEEYYEVSNIGNVIRKKGTSHLKIKKLKMILDKDGYHRVNLKVKQKAFNKMVHRLVCEAFIPNPENKPQVNHINGIKGDNRLENLEWCTLSENRQHAYDIGLQNSYSRRGIKNNFAKLTDNDIIFIRKKYKEDQNITQKELGKLFNVSKTCISHIILGKNWKWL